jgi:hypothetical protein
MNCSCGRNNSIIIRTKVLGLFNRECLKDKRREEINQVEGVFWIGTFGQLPVVVTIDKQLNVSSQGTHSPRKASGLARQTFEIMTQIGIDGFDGVGFLLVGSHFVGSSIIQGVISRKGIAVILFGLRCSFQAGLQGFRSSL